MVFLLANAALYQYKSIGFNLNNRSGALGSRLKRLGFDLASYSLGPLALRMMLGRTADATERDAFRRAMRCKYMPMPPLLRGFAIFAEFQSLVQRMQFYSWQRGMSDISPDRVFVDHLLEAVLPPPPDFTGNFYAVWDKPAVAFLHLEKCGGTALMHWLSMQFHPTQIDFDPDRAQPAHLYYRHPRDFGQEARRCKLIWGHYGVPALRRLDPDRFIFTLLREPRARLLSLYHYWRSVDPALLDPAEGNFTVALAHRFDLLEFLRHDDPFLRDYLDNFYVRRLTGRYATGAKADPLAGAPEAALAAARSALSGLGFVGITERMDESIAGLAELIGVPPPALVPHANAAADNHASPTGWFRSVRQSTLTPAIEAELARLTRLDQVLYAEALVRFEGSPARKASMAPA